VYADWSCFELVSSNPQCGRSLYSPESTKHTPICFQTTQ